MKNKNILLFALALLFFGFGIISMKNAMPSKKEERIYNQISKFLPYEIEKRVGGFTIIFKDTNEKVKPSNEEFFKKIESMDRHWAKTHLKVVANDVIILDDKKQQIQKIALQTSDEKVFVLTYFGLGVLND